MKKLKIPRKLKKQLKKGIWFYPADEDGNSLMASPHNDLQDFGSYKKDILRNLIDKSGSRHRQIEFSRKINREVSIPDKELKKYVDDIIRKGDRQSSYEILLTAKNDHRASSAYYNFINAYQLFEKGEESFENICCLSIDKARDLLRKK